MHGNYHGHLNFFEFFFLTDILDKLVIIAYFGVRRSFAGDSFEYIDSHYNTKISRYGLHNGGNYSAKVFTSNLM